MSIDNAAARELFHKKDYLDTVITEASEDVE